MVFVWVSFFLNPGFTEEDVALTQNKVIKDNTRAYESFYAKLSLFREISKYNKPPDFVEKDQETLQQMSLEDFKTLIDRYLNEEERVYVVVGDKATQLEEVKKLSKPVVELDLYGNAVE